MSPSRWWFDGLYLLGRIPWDTGVTPPEVVEWVESEDAVPGRALDLGCGTGTNSLYLARHGWETVGVDFSRLAIRRARRKARRLRMDVQFYAADVANLAFLQDSFDFALDIGCLHSIPPEGQKRTVQEMVRLVKPDGLMMLYAFRPRPDASVTRGFTPQEVEAMFALGFVVERVELGDDTTGPPSAWYWLRRV